jgi:Bacterial Ig-like domain
VLAGLVLAGLAACANPGNPPGGPRDRLPPQVVETVPDTFALVEPFSGAIRIKFNERISERVAGGSLDRAVQVSPRTGVVRVKHKRDGLEVSVAGGFQAGLVYRVTVLPVVNDMFQNPMKEAFEFVFSTGPPPLPNVLAGIVVDRITGRARQGISIVATPSQEEDGVQNVAQTDSAGIYALRYLPEGTYRVQAFEDVNRNDEADRQEPRAEAVRTVTNIDTIFAHLSILAPDTTAAIVASTEAVDASTLRIVFDDYLDPDSSLAAVTVSLAREDEAAPRPDSVLHWYEYQERMDSLAARVAEDGDAPVTPPQEAARARPRPGGRRGGQGLGGGGIGLTSAGMTPLGEPLPGREVYVLLSDTLISEVPYVVTVSGVTNIAGTAGGGGEDTLSYTPPPPPDTTGAAGDSTSVRADTTVVQPDTAVVQADTTVVQPDTAGVQLDTLRLGRDTLLVHEVEPSVRRPLIPRRP